MFRFICLFLLFFHVATMFAQGVTIGANTPPHPSAALDVQSSNQGFLPPRLTTAQRNAIVSPQTGLHIYNIDTDCVEVFFASGGWKPLNCGCTNFPNAVFSMPSAAVGAAVTFNAPSGGVGYAWSFQNGSPANATVAAPSVTWSSAGKYLVTLVVTDNGGCSSTHRDSVDVLNCPPAVNRTFTSCGATGRQGPSQGQCDATYGSGVVTVNSGIQFWTVPQTGRYRIDVRGAKGGKSASNLLGGSGAVIQGEVQLTQGTVLKIVVGQLASEQFGQTSWGGGGGGGGSFVATSTNTPIMVAGGGGGGGFGINHSLINGTTNTAGANGSNATGGQAGGAGGTNGNGGGQAGSATSGNSGAGFFGNGQDGADSRTTLSNSFVNGAVAGFYSSGFTADAGFGGGGAYLGSGGGGGGYSGGGNGGWEDSNPSGASGGGGGSFIISTATNVATSNGLYEGSSNLNGAISNLSTYNNGPGSVTIQLVCP